MTDETVSCVLTVAAAARALGAPYSSDGWHGTWTRLRERGVVGVTFGQRRCFCQRLLLSTAALTHLSHLEHLGA